MTPQAQALLSDLRSSAVDLTVRDGDLIVTGPADVMTATMYQQVAFHKAELIEALTVALASSRALLPPLPEPERHPEAVVAQFHHHAVELRRDGKRWLMFVDGTRRRDFASPHLIHAKRTAECWYGPPTSGWKEIA